MLELHRHNGNWKLLEYDRAYIGTIVGNRGNILYIIWG